MLRKWLSKIVLIWVSLMATDYGLALETNSKIEPYLNIIANQIERDPDTFVAKFGLAKSGTQLLINVFVTGLLDETPLTELGGKIIDRFGAVTLAAVPVTALEQVAGLAGVKYLEVPRRHRLSTDVSVPETGAPKLWTNKGLTGKGVLIGIIDTGIDWRHHDFRSADGKTRIKYLLDLSEKGSVYGAREYTQADINRALIGAGTVNQVDQIGHGTHVTGIAAGDGSHDAQFGTFVGAAPEADLIIVKTTREVAGTTITEDDQLTAMRYIDEKARQLGQPYVVNLSLGGQYGPHDGTTAYERALTSFVGPGQPGKILVAAAGNDGDADIHAAGKLSNTANRIAIEFEIDDYVPLNGTANDEFWIDIWYDGAADLAATVKTPGGAGYGPVATVTTRRWHTADGTITIQKSNVNPNNGDKEILVLINDEQTPTPRSGKWAIELTGTSGKFDAWLVQSSMDARLLAPLENAKKVTVPGTAELVITVGAYHTKNTWRDRDNKSWGLRNPPAKGDLALFSNPGPTRDGRQKPDVTAPGIMIGASLSIDAPPTSPNSVFYVPPGSLSQNLYILTGDEHAMAQGTSMAAPHVSGIVALLLQENPNISADQVRSQLKESARADNFTSAVPNPRWGYGKVDAVQAEQTIPGNETPSQFAVDPGFPNPARSRIEFRYNLPLAELPVKVTVKVYNVLGQEIRILRQELASVGSDRVFWDGTNENGTRMGSGVYFLEFRAGSRKEIRKFLLLTPKQ